MRKRSSPSTLVTPYTLPQPYAIEEATTTARTPCVRQASSTLNVPSTFTATIVASLTGGLCAECQAARCTTAVQPCTALRTSVTVRVSQRTNSRSDSSSFGGGATSARRIV